MNDVALFTGGILSLALLLVLPNQAVVHADPFQSAEITISPRSGPAGTEVTVKGEHFAPSSTVSISFDGDSVNTSPGNISVKKDGKFNAKFVVPDIDIDDDDDDEKTVRATDNSIFRNSASASFDVKVTGGSSSEEEEAKITISPRSGPAGTEVTVKGEHFAPSSTVSITFDDDSVSTSPETITVANDGRFSAKFVVPDTVTDDGTKTIRATDDSDSSNSASDRFEVTGSGGVPNEEEEPTRESTRDAEARSQSVTMDEDTTRLLVLKASHQDDDDHFSITDNPSHGSLFEFDSEAGTVTYSPYADYFGSDRFTFRVSGSDVLGTVSITIREINDRPTARNAQVTTLEESAVQVILSGSDVDDDVTFSIVGMPTHGTLSGTAPNLTYLPDKDYDGYDSFRFTTSDGQSHSDVANVAIRVSGLNDPPVVDAQMNMITKENDDVRITLIATDIDSQTVSFTIVSGPEHGTLSRPMTTAPNVAIATYSPNPYYNGHDTFTFTVNDGSQDNGISNTGRVTIMVGSLANTKDESVGDTNTAESSDLSSSPEGSGNRLGDAENSEIIHAPNGGTELIDNKKVPLISFGNLIDTVPPSLRVPSRSIIIDASTFIGATVNYESTASDNVDGPITIHCYPRSGLIFPVGESVVKCNATDKAGNTSERSFAVIVKPFEFDNSSLLQLSIAIVIAGIGAVAVLMVIRKRRHNFLAKENHDATKLILNVYHLVKVACFRK